MTLRSFTNFSILAWGLRYSLKKRKQQNKCALILKDGAEAPVANFVLGFKENFMQSLLASLLFLLLKKRIVFKSSLDLSLDFSAFLIYVATDHNWRKNTH